MTWGGWIMNYAHSEANVQTIGWLICLNARQPHLPALRAQQPRAEHVHEANPHLDPDRRRRARIL